MFTNRLFTLFVAVALGAVVTLTVREAIATKAVIVDHSYDSIEQIRTVGRPVSNVEVNRAYDLIEQLRVDRAGIGSEAERSYDPIEQVRTERLE